MAEAPMVLSDVSFAAEDALTVALDTPPLSELARTPLSDLAPGERDVVLFYTAIRDLRETLDPELDLAHHPERIPLLHRYVLFPINAARSQYERRVLITLVALWDGDGPVSRDAGQVAQIIGSSIERTTRTFADLEARGVLAPEAHA